MHSTPAHLILTVGLLLQMPTAANAATRVAAAIDWPAFLSQHDMVWDRTPNRWEVAPYTGNGNVGFLFYQAKGSPKNVISLYAGRHDYYDHREPHNGKELLWVYRSRLPLGRFDIESQGDIQSVDLRLSLWNAELTGTIQTSQGAYRVRGLTHSGLDVLYLETEAGGREAIQIRWRPEKPISPVKQTLSSGGPRGRTWDAMRSAPYPLPPEPILSQEEGYEFCLQPLVNHRGETTTGWEVTGDPAGKQRLIASVHHSFPEHDSRQIVKANLRAASSALNDESFVPSHRAWWNAYYPQSFLTLNDPEKEAFYWVQMYKFASATRGDGPIMDLMGPWYHKTFWPMVWGDLNVQLQYWTHLTANRMSVGESLANNLDKYAGNLANNVPQRWDDSASVAALMPQDLVAHAGGNVPDMLVWMLHDYWLHCEYAGDRERMRDGLFPLLRKAVNGYRHYLEDNPVSSSDGTIHIKNSWSPEYPGGRGQDINFTIALMRWSCQTLLDINEEFQLNDPLADDWRALRENLVDFQIDENGLRIGKDVPFDKPHRHYSHLLAFYPLAVLKPDTPNGKRLLRTSLDHWLDVTFHRENTTQAMAVTGYTATGAASMYAMLGDSERAAHYLDFFIQHDRVSPTTMYAEGNPVIESPLSFATCIHDMLLQSWGGVIRVLPAAPPAWPDVAFHQLRSQGAFLVSAKRQGGQTLFVEIQSTRNAPCVVQTDIENPVVFLNGRAAGERVQANGAGHYRCDLEEGDSLVFRLGSVPASELTISPIAVEQADRNLFGLNKNTERLPGHKHYYRP